MKRRELPPPSAEIEALLRTERTLVAQPDELRSRALERARAALRQGSTATRGRKRPWGMRRAMVFALAASLTLIAMGAAAYQARGLWAARRLISVELRSDRTSNALATSGVVQVEQAPLAPVASSEIEPVAKPRAAVPSRSAAGRDEDAFAEIRLLERARQAVARGEFASALTALADDERHFPAGRLAEEREALKVRALLGLDRRDEARRVAVEFRKRFPRSVLLPRMDEMLNTP